MTIFKRIKEGLKEIKIYGIYMNNKDFKKLCKKQLIELLFKQNAKPKIVIVDDYKQVVKKPVPIPRTKQVVQNYDDKIILPPSEFRQGC